MLYNINVEVISMIEVRQEGSQIRIVGPKDYMEERGNDLIRRIGNGEEKEKFEMYLSFQPDPLIALKVLIQTDYAAWKGNKQVESWMSKYERKVIR